MTEPYSRGGNSICFKETIVASGIVPEIQQYMNSTSLLNHSYGK